MIRRGREPSRGTWSLPGGRIEAGESPEVAIRYGAFINSLISFVVIAFVVWQIGKIFIKEEPKA